MMSPISKINKADAVFGGAMFLIAPVGLFASKATVPLLIIAALALAFGRNFDRSLLKNIPQIPTAGLTLLLFWALLSSIWSVDPALSLKPILPLAALLAVGLVTVSNPIENQQLIQSLLVAGLILAMALLAFETATGNWLTRTGNGLRWIDIYDGYSPGYNVDARLKNGIVILTLLFWPTAAILWRHNKRLITTSLFIVLLFLAFNYKSTTSMLALISGGMFVIAAHQSARYTARLLAVLFFIGILTTPVLTHTFLTSAEEQKIVADAKSFDLPSSAVNRLFTWKFVGEKIGERPILGWGFNSSKNIPDGNDKYTLRDMSIGVEGKVLFKDFHLPLHPHNNPLQIWLELGGIGACIVALFGGLLIWRTGEYSSRTGPWLFGLIVSILMFDLLSFGAWQNWWIAAQFLAFSSLFGSKRRPY